MEEGKDADLKRKTDSSLLHAFNTLVELIDGSFVYPSTPQHLHISCLAVQRATDACTGTEAVRVSVPVAVIKNTPTAASRKEEERVYSTYNSRSQFIVAGKPMQQGHSRVHTQAQREHVPTFVSAQLIRTQTQAKAPPTCRPHLSTSVNMIKTTHPPPRQTGHRST